MFELIKGHSSEGGAAVSLVLAAKERSQVRCLDSSNGRCEDQSLDYVAQLADIARPDEGLEAANGLLAELLALPSMFGGKVPT